MRGIINILRIKENPFKEIVPNLTLNELKTLIKYLPKPEKKIILGKNEKVEFEIYLVKELYNSYWRDPVLFRLLLQTRTSYNIYGELPPLDSYDLKSQIYLVRCRYTIKTTNEYLMEEWLSARFIPYYGEPLKFRDIEMFEYRGRVIEYWIKKRLLNNKKLDWNSVINSSGLCGIGPFSIRKTANSQENALIQDLRYTSVALALIVKEFITSSNPPFFYLMVQVPEEFAEKALTFRINNQAFKPNLTLAAEALAIKKANQIKLRRNNQLIYKRPFYFLDRKSLLELLRNLIKNGILTAETFEYYLGDSALANKLLNNEKTTVRDFSKLGKIFNAKGKIFGARITGVQLRNILKKVPDGPQLRIMKSKDYILSLQKIINAADSL